MRRHDPRISKFSAGIIGIVVIGIACYFVFGGSLPWAGTPFQLKAVFTSQTQMHIPSPVRIAGVDVGEVTSVTRIKGSSAGLMTMSINRNGLPLHADATAKIRPRLFVEGNFYVDLAPGTPSAPTLHSGSTLSAGHTAGPVQLDRVLSALNSDARTNLQTLLQGLGGAFDARPTAAQDATQDPSVRGLTGGQALNLSLKYSPDAFKASAMVNQALLGLQPHDLSGSVKGNEEVFRALAASGNQLAGFVTNFNTTMAALAARQQDLSQTISLLPPFLARTQSSDSALDASFGPTKAFARAFTPGIHELGPTIDAGLPWIAQASALMSPQELGGLVRYLTPAIQNTGATISATKSLITQSDLLTRCFEHNIVPTGNQVIADPPVGTGQPVYRELFQTAVGIASAAQNFDGNGRYIRANAGGGDVRVTTPPLLGGAGPAYGNGVLPVLGTRPAFAGSPPPVRRDVACYRNAAPALNQVTTGPGS